MMKKSILTRILALLLALLMLFTLSACQKDDGKDKDNQGGNEQKDDDGNKDEEILPYQSKFTPLATRTPYTLEEDHGVLGEGKGVNPGRVVWNRDSRALSWDGRGFWWNEDNFNETVIDAMLRDAICALAGEENIRVALDAIFREFNYRVNGDLTGTGYIPGEKITIKANMNCVAAGTSPSANNSTGLFATPVLMRSLLGILVDYGVRPGDIVVADPSRTVPTYLQDLCSQGKLQGVRFVFYDPNGVQDAVADLDAPIVFSYDVGGEPCYFPTVYTEADYIINFANFKGHTLAGFTFTAKNHYGSFLVGQKDPVTKEVAFPAAYRKNPPTYAAIHNFIA
ncbi:MAG: DUF362 domain-containing protein, partial [Clostridia bacterium]|nr:DUF362 domain-containing protein [Clostridia bacterium]